MIRPPLLTLRDDEIIVDSFAGGGGASEGIAQALGRGPDVAINHDAEAIALHKANHPRTTHYQESVWQVDPVAVCAGRKVGLMWLSPDCKHFSKAKGGKPVSKKIRGLAWIAIRWAAAVRPRVIVLENVEEFRTWGPVLDDGRPCPVRKGKTFRAFVRKIERLGYEVQHRELRACDYGAPTIRKRLFMIARCDGEAIRWPVPTHGKGRDLPWRTAAECIDWSLPCPSIFERKKPLAPNTQRRIARGLDRFVLNNPRPFIVSLTHHGGDRAKSIDVPFATITGANRGEKALIAPTLVQTGYGERPDLWRCADCGYEYDRGDLPVCGCVKCGSEADPLLVPGQAPRAPGLDKPLGTVVAGGQKHALVAAFLAKHFSERKPGEVMAADLFDPAPTVTTVDHSALVTSHLEVMHGTSGGASMREPMQTVLGGGNHLAEVRAFMVAYYGNEKDGGTLFDPARTVTSKERFGLVTVHGIEYVIADIGMRMLAPRELYRAQGFPESYKIDVLFNGKPLTKTAQVRMCGNSVCPPLARAIVLAQFHGEVVAQEVAA